MWLSRREGVCQPELDERLAGDADAPGLPVDLLQEIERKVYVDTLHGSPRPVRVGEVEMSGEVAAFLVQLVQTGSGCRLHALPLPRASPRCNALFPLAAHAGPR